MNYILYDVIIAAVLLLFLWLGYRKGFVLTLCGFLALFVGLIGASLISNALAEPVAQAIRPMVEQAILDHVNNSVSISAVGTEYPDISQLDISILLNALRNSDVYQGLANAFQAAVDTGVVEVTTNAARSLADYFAVQIARVVLFILAFAAVQIAWSFLSHALDLAFKLPVLSTLNRWAGAAVGLLKGGLLIFIAAWLLKDSFLPPDAVEGSYLLRFFCTAGPLSLFSLVSQ